MQIFCPGDPIELKAMLKKILKINGPKYLRIGKKGEPNINLSNLKIDIKSPNTIFKGNEIIILSVGNMLGVSKEVYDKLKSISKGYASFDYHVSGYKPANLAIVIGMIC